MRTANIELLWEIRKMNTKTNEDKNSKDGNMNYMTVRQVSISTVRAERSP